MKSFINSCLKKLKIVSIISHDVVGNNVVFYSLIFKNSSGKFGVFECIYTYVDIFLINGIRRTNYLTDGNSNDLSLEDKILMSVSFFNNIEDALNSRLFDNVNEDYLSKFITHFLNEFSQNIKSISVPDIDVLDVEVVDFPTFMCFVKYTYRGIMQSPLKIFIGNKLSLDNFSYSLLPFIRNINNIIEGGVINE